MNGQRLPEKAWGVQALCERKREAERVIATAIKTAIDSFVADTGWREPRLSVTPIEVTRINDSYRRYRYGVHLSVNLDDPEDRP